MNKVLIDVALFVILFAFGFETDVFQASRHDAVWLVLDFLQVKAYLGGPEAEGCGLDVGFLFVHQQQRFVFYETQVLPRGHVPQSERLTPADMTPAPPGHKHSHRT